MTVVQILNACKHLSQSQGAYGRLYEYLKENREALEYLASLNFKDEIDFIMYIEC